MCIIQPTHLPEGCPYLLHICQRGAHTSYTSARGVPIHPTHLPEGCPYSLHICPRGDHTAFTSARGVPTAHPIHPTHLPEGYPYSLHICQSGANTTNTSTNLSLYQNNLHLAGRILKVQSVIFAILSKSIRICIDW